MKQFTNTLRNRKRTKAEMQYHCELAADLIEALEHALGDMDKAYGDLLQRNGYQAETDSRRIGWDALHKLRGLNYDHGE